MSVPLSESARLPWALNRLISPVPLGADHAKTNNVVPLRLRAGQAKRRNGVVKRTAERKRKVKR